MTEVPLKEPTPPKAPIGVITLNRAQGTELWDFLKSTLSKGITMLGSSFLPKYAEERNLDTLNSIIGLFNNYKEREGIERLKLTYRYTLNKNAAQIIETGGKSLKDPIPGVWVSDDSKVDEYIQGGIYVNSNFSITLYDKNKLTELGDEETQGDVYAKTWKRKPKEGFSLQDAIVGIIEFQMSPSQVNLPESIADSGEPPHK